MKVSGPLELAGIEVVVSLPVTDLFEGRVVLYAGNIYYCVSSAWIPLPVTGLPDPGSGAPDQILRTDGTNALWADQYPDKTGMDGKFLGLSGLTVGWFDPPTTIPAQAGHAGEFLSTDGSSTSWEAISQVPSQTGADQKFLRSDAGTAIWDVIGLNDLPLLIPADRIGSGNVSDTEFGYLDGVSGAIQTQIDGKQPLDADLTAIAALSTTGFSARTAASTWALRTLTGTANRIVITNGAGIAGDPTFDIGSTVALNTGTLAQFAATTSAQLAGIISDETGSGALVFGTSPTLATPVISSYAEFPNQGAIRLLEQTGNGTNYVGFSAPDAVTSNLIWKLPNGDGTSGQVLQTNGSGQLGWTNTASTNNPSFTGSIGVPDGSVTVPALAFTSDADGTGTGIYRVAANTLGFSANGVNVGQYSAAGWVWGTTGVTATNSLYGNVLALADGNGLKGFTIRMMTADAADDNRLTISGAGAAGPTRGAYMELRGNEFSSLPGRILFESGSTASGTNIAWQVNVGASSVSGHSINGNGLNTFGPSSGATGQHVIQGDGTANYTLQILATNASASSGQSNGLSIRAGITSADTALSIANRAGTVGLMNVSGIGSCQFGPTAGFSASGAAHLFYGNTQAAELCAIFRKVTGGDTSSNYICGFGTDTQTQGYIWNNASGNIELITVSDATLKTNVRTATYGLTELMGLRPVLFDWISGAATDVKGFIAQEFQTILPKSVAVGPDGKLLLGHDELFPLLVKSAQELKGLVDAAATSAASAVTTANAASTAASSAATTAAAAQTTANAAQTTANAASAAVAGKISETVSNETALGTVAWTATLAPSGTITKSYRWSKQGRLVTVWWRIEASIAGTVVTGASAALPAEMPVPAIYGTQPNNSWIATGSGFLLSSLNVPLSQAASGIFRNNTGGYELRINAGAGLTASAAGGSVTYLAAS